MGRRADGGDRRRVPEIFEARLPLRPTSYRVVLTPKTIAPASLASILRRSARGYAQCTIDRFGRHFGLTSKEVETLDHVASGTSPKEVAGVLACSIQAVYAHLTRICDKTSCASYQEVVAMLFRFSCHGLGRAIGVEGKKKAQG